MLRFQHQYILITLALILVLVLIYFFLLYWRKNKITQVGNAPLVQQQLLGYIKGRQTLKFVLRASALTFIILGCANLQKSGNEETLQRKGVDVIIALDVSKSMLAKDVQPNRLTRAKQFIERLNEKMSNDRIGLVIFAGRSYLQVPLTIDYSALKLLLQTVSPEMVPTQGTVIGEAIALANESFSSRERKYKSIVVISDGEDHDENALNEVKKATEAGVIIHTIGVGSPQGAPLFDPSTNAPKLDEQGNPITTKLNEDELRSIASAGNGTYNLLNNADASAQKIIDELSKMEQRNLGAVVYNNYTSYFQYFLAIALILLVIDWLTPGSKIQSRKKTSLAIVCIAAFLMTQTNNAYAQSAKKLINQGNQLYQQGKYKDAALYYGQSLQKDTSLASKSAYNLGNALYQQNQNEAARKAFEAASRRVNDQKEKAQIDYNVGNTYMAEKKWQEAIEAYKNTLRKNPQDADAKYNLAYAKAMLQKNGNEGKNEDKQQDKKEQEKKDQKENQQQQEQQNQDKQNEENKDQQAQSQPSKMSEKQAEQILNALQQEEKKLQEKNKKIKGTPTKLEKDW